MRASQTALCLSGTISPLSPTGNPHVSVSGAVLLFLSTCSSIVLLGIVRSYRADIPCYLCQLQGLGGSRLNRNFHSLGREHG